MALEIWVVDKWWLVKIVAAAQSWSVFRNATNAYCILKVYEILCCQQQKSTITIKVFFIQTNLKQKQQGSQKYT